MGKSNTSSWVPQQVADFVATALLEPHDQASLDRLRRLMTSPDMQPAWKTLAGETTDSDLLIAFTRQAAFSLWLSWGAQLLPLSSPTQARQQARKVVQASQALLKHLEALGEHDCLLWVHPVQRILRVVEPAARAGVKLCMALDQGVSRMTTPS